MAVRAINAKEIEIKFNEKVKNTTIDNISVNLVGDPSATNLQHGGVVRSLSTDGKTVTIKANNIYLGKYAVTVPVSVLSDADDTPVVPYTVTLDIKDTTAPTVTKLEYTGGKAVLTFSEPLKVTPSVLRINGVQTTSISLDSTLTKVSTAAFDLASGTSATVYAAGAKDFADNEMALFNGTVSAPATDTSKPAIISVAQVDHDVIRVVFNRQLTTTPLSGQLGYRKDMVSAAVYGVATLVDVSVDPDGKTYDVKFDATTLYGTADSAIVTLIMAKDAVVADTFKNDAYSQSFTFTADRTGPKYVSYKVDDQKKYVDFSFDENLVAGSGQVTIISSDSVNLGGVTPSLATVNGKQVLRVTKDLLVGTYNFSFPAGLVKDDHGNKSAAFSVTVNVGATPTDPVKPVVSLASQNNNAFLVGFTKEMGSSAVSHSNYKLDGNALPTGTTIYFNDATKKEITITLPANSITISGPAILTVSNVADKDGVVALTTNLTVELGDNTAPTVVSAPVHNATAKTITYTFSEPVKLLSGATTTASKYGIYKVTDGDYGPNVVSDTSIVLVTMTGNSLTFTYTGSLTSGTYIVDAWGDKIVDAAGNVIANIDVDATNYLFTVN